MKNSIKQDVNGFTRELCISPPFDRRNADPSKNYGIHGMEFRFHLIKDNCAMQFVAYTGLQLPHVMQELWDKRDSRYNPFEGQGADVGYHSIKPMYDDQTKMSDKCEVTGVACYYDGSGLRAREWYKVWLSEGNDRIWELLEEAYRERFGGE